jgi:cation diffusion facilitator CzcD-associated flavoprotein CzcO
MQTLVQIQQMHAEISKRTLIDMVAKQLPDGYDVETHFTPRHMPQDQRVCRVLDGDLFQKISSGKIEMVTDEIDRFTETAIVTKSGDEIKCDIVITATGFNLSVLGGVRFTVDGDEVNFADSITYRELDDAR